MGTFNNIFLQKSYTYSGSLSGLFGLATISPLLPLKFLGVPENNEYPAGVNTVNSSEPSKSLLLSHSFLYLLKSFLQQKLLFFLNID